MELRAPAKLNLGLRVVGVRPDGYHQIESLFVPLSLADRLTLAATGTPGVHLELTGPATAGVPEDGTNLAVRAAERYLACAGLGGGLDLHLEKHVPSPAGLGGGSSDAGSVLRGLAALHPGALGLPELEELALELGADVPYFLQPRPALVSGIGERIEPLAGLPELPIVWAHPGEPLSTPAVYSAYDEDPVVSLTPGGAASSIRRLLGLRGRGADLRATLFDDFPGEASGRTEDALQQLLVNDLEAAATRLCPGVGKLGDAIKASGALASSMSGSGPTVYGVYADTVTAQRAAAELRASQAARVETATTIPSP